MIDFSKEQDNKKISLNEPIVFGPKKTGPAIEDNPELTREVIEEE